MLGVVNVNIICFTQADSDFIYTAVDNYITGLPGKVEQRSDLRTSLHHGQWEVLVEIGYDKVSTAQDVFTQVQDLWGQNPTYKDKVQLNSWVRWHECHADEGDSNCADNPGAIAVKTVM